MKSSLLARRVSVAAMFALLLSCGGDDDGAFQPFIVFASDRTTPTTLFRMNLDGSNVQILVLDESYYGAVDNSGTLLVYSDDTDLYLKNLNTGVVTPLAANASVDFRPVLDWSGTKVAFVSDRDGGDLEIWVVNTNGTGLTRVTNQPGINNYPAFSPDGQRVAFAYQGGVTAEIFVANVNGTGLTNLSNNVFEDVNPSFSPDGTKILFSSNRNGDYDLYTMNVDGSGQTLLFHRDGRELNASFTPDGNRVVFYGTNIVAGPAQIYIANIDGSNITNLSNNNVTETRTAGIIPGGS